MKGKKQNSEEVNQKASSSMAIKDGIKKITLKPVIKDEPEPANFSPEGEHLRRTKVQRPVTVCSR